MDLEQTSNQSDIFDLSTPRTWDRSFPPNAIVPTSYSTGDDISVEDSICRECTQVDWDSLPSLVETFATPFLNVRYQTIRTIEANHEHLAASFCKICRILSVVKPKSLDETELIVNARPLSSFNEYGFPRSWTSRCTITALNVCPNDRHGRDIRHSRCLAVMSRDGEGFNSRMISPRSIDYEWLKHLAQSCEEGHERGCRRGSLGPVSVPGLKVIEVSSRTVDEAPVECRYVALSYVWGKQPDLNPTSHLQHPPQVIEDAISVTIAMGYKYLWIDRYCIPQANDQERHHMINQMAQVYANASLTIIDASGGDAKKGLPGVSVFASRIPNCVHIRNTSILELPCGAHELRRSKWATRGWTYQEGYFSTRRLIFTPSQVLFLCNENYQEESVRRLLQQDDPASSYDLSRFGSLIPGFGDKEPMHFYLETKLQEYSKRELTRPGDSLNAFLGVINFHAHKSRSLESRILHVSWGLIAQRWFHTAHLRVYLDWYHEAPAERRLRFPSWAWAGWGGPLKFDKLGITLYKRGNDSRPLSHLEWEISWESNDHKDVTIREFANDCLSSSNTDNLQLHQQPIYPNRLKVTCFVVPIRFQVVPLTEAQKTQESEIHFENETNIMKVKRVNLSKENLGVVQLCQGIYIAAPTYLDQDSIVSNGVVGLLFAVEDGVIYKGLKFGCVLAHQLNDGIYERVGLIPVLLYYPEHVWEPDSFYYLQRCVFLDETGRVLNKVRVSASEKRSPFEDVGERRTIFLV